MSNLFDYLVAYLILLHSPWILDFQNPSPQGKKKMRNSQNHWSEGKNFHCYPSFLFLFWFQTSEKDHIWLLSIFYFWWVFWLKHIKRGHIKLINIIFLFLMGLLNWFSWTPCFLNLAVSTFAYCFLIHNASKPPLMGSKIQRYTKYLMHDIDILFLIHFWFCTSSVCEYILFLLI